MKIEDCKEGVKVRWEAGDKSDCGIIIEHKGSIWKDATKEGVWATWDSSNHKYPQHAELKYMTLVEQPLQDTQVITERKYSKEEIVEYMDYIGYINVETNIQGIDDYFTSDNEEERKAINLLKSKGYTVQK